MATLTFEPEFDHIYVIDGEGRIADRDDLLRSTSIWAPEVINDPTEDVYISAEGWSVLKGHTGQHGYNGAVMHPSEQWGQWAIDALAAEAGDGYVVFAVTEVRPDLDEQDNDDYSDETPIGWAVVWQVEA